MSHQKSSRTLPDSLSSDTVNRLSRRDFLRAASGVAAGALLTEPLGRAGEGRAALQLTQRNGGTGELDFSWHGSRPWLGPDWHAAPLHSWRVAEGIAECLPDSLEQRYATVTSRELEFPERGFAIETELRFDPVLESKAAYRAGILFGVHGAPDTFEHAVVYAEESVFAGIGADGSLRIEDKQQPIDLSGSWVRLRLIGEGLPDGQIRIRLLAADASGRALGEVSNVLPKHRLTGAFGLAVRAQRGPEETPDPVAAFKSFALEGRGFTARPGNRFGPILWTQYSLSAAGLRLQAQFPPLGEGDAAEAVLELKQGDRWREAARAPIEPVSSTALFTLKDWDSSVPADYRVRYRFLGEDYHWEGSVRREPNGEEPWKLGLFSCDYGTLFPLKELVAELRERDPAMLFFAGDQFYEWFGGFLFVRTPPWKARLDYLRKWYLFGWSFRDILKDRPSIIITDDHDVFQGNIWGQQGRPIPGYDPATDARFKAPFSKGGYAMEPDWVNLVQRAQSGHLPPPHDPQPVEQGIGVVYTGFAYGGVSFAVLEDRKFKTGPASEKARRGEAELLGQRQLAFLEDWAQDWKGARIKTVLSQTIFAQPMTHGGPTLRRTKAVRDNNAWPEAGRNAAVRAIRKAGAFSLHGDQHLAVTMRHGLDDWEDAGIAFMGPATVAGFPRAFWPEDTMRQGPAQTPAGASTPYAGRYLDDFGHKITVDAVANPLEPERWGGEYPNNHPEDPTGIALDKASGYGIIDFLPAERTVTLHCHPLPYPGTDPARLEKGEFKGWPLSYHASANDGRKPVGHLPELRFNLPDPVVGLYNASTGELVYARRVEGMSFAPPIFAEGRYAVRVGLDYPSRMAGNFDSRTTGTEPVEVHITS